MIYILTEDIKSGYDFWISVNKNILNSKARIITSKGIKNLEAQVSKLIDDGHLGDNDFLILVTDKTAHSDVIHQYRNIKRMAQGVKFGLVISNLYCIEELFVSSNTLVEWCKLKKYKEELEFIRECLWNDIDYREKPNDKLQEYINNKTLTAYKDPINREKLVASILSEATKGTPFSFCNKSYSNCWHLDCCHIEDSGTKIYGEMGCNLYGEDYIIKGKSKLMELIESSILPLKLGKNNIDRVYDMSKNSDDEDMIYYKDLLINKGLSLGEITNKDEQVKRGNIKYKEGYLEKIDSSKDIFESVYYHIEGLLDNPDLSNIINNNSKIKGF